MVIFHSYFDITRGYQAELTPFLQLLCSISPQVSSGEHQFKSTFARSNNLSGLLSGLLLQNLYTVSVLPVLPWNLQLNCTMVDLHHRFFEFRSKLPSRDFRGTNRNSHERDPIPLPPMIIGGAWECHKMLMISVIGSVPCDNFTLCFGKGSM